MNTKEVCLQDPALLRLAAHQAARDEEVQAARRQVAELEAELGDAQRTLDLQTEQSAALKEVGRARLSPASARCCPGSSPGCCSRSRHVVESQQIPCALPGIRRTVKSSCGDDDHCHDSQLPLVEEPGCLQALRDMEREKARQRLGEADRQDLTYLKNILLKLFETGVWTRLLDTASPLALASSEAAAAKLTGGVRA